MASSFGRDDTREELVRIFGPSLSVTNNNGSRRKKIYIENLGDPAQLLGSQLEAVSTWKIYPTRSSTPVTVGDGFRILTYSSGIWVSIETYMALGGKLMWTVMDCVDPEQLISGSQVVFDSFDFDSEMIVVRGENLGQALREFATLKNKPNSWLQERDILYSDYVNPLIDLLRTDRFHPNVLQMAFADVLRGVFDTIQNTWSDSCEDVPNIYFNCIDGESLVHESSIS